MINDCFQGKARSIYGEEQAVFAKMKREHQMRKRRQRRRRALMWLLRRL